MGRLNDGSPSGPTYRTADEVREECWERNQRMHRMGWPRWYLVRDTEIGWEMQSIEGANAEEVWTLMAGKQIDYSGWDALALAKINGLARWRMQHGMPRHLLEAPRQALEPA